ncbi:MAG: hypothetical protein ACJ8M1_08280 [Chthoniobacterales bacterium]
MKLCIQSSNQSIAMTRIICLTALAAVLVGFCGCDKKTSEDLQQKADKAKQTIETRAKEAKQAADKQIENAKPKLRELSDKAKQAAKDAEPKVREFGEKAKDAADSAAEKVKEATNGSSSTPTP